MRDFFLIIFSFSLALNGVSATFVEDGLALALAGEGVEVSKFSGGKAGAGAGGGGKKMRGQAGKQGAGPEEGQLGGGGKVTKAATIGQVLDRKNWVVTCDSFQPGAECAKAIDGDKNTLWHTPYGQKPTPLPHTITLDMKVMQNVRGISVLPRQDGKTGGLISRHQVLLSIDGKKFLVVAFGTWHADNGQKVANFETYKVRYVRLVALSEGFGNPFTSIAEINVYGGPDPPQKPQGVGRWGPTINFPVIPVAASMTPAGKVVVWSSWDKDQFVKGPRTLTLTATYDPNTGMVSQRRVTNTRHDMFCPGISLDENCRTIVTGGNAAKRTSIYDPAKDAWISAPDMVIPRGYQSSATTADGKVFTIGGSFTGGHGNKNGEIYDVRGNKWTALPQCPVAPMLTTDRQGLYRSDNHAFLFGWKGNTVFQAGPSKAMNWYTMTGQGGTKPAGNRADDVHAMCGIAVMFDAGAGKILTAGGANDYENTPSTTNGFIITINEPNQNPQVKRTSNNMSFNRIYHNAVILPNGETFIVGGQAIGMPFRETNVRLMPEMYSPVTDKFRTLVENSIPRVYHAFALLLQDGTVLSGGGGLCGNCDTNHFDAQIYIPPYLYNKEGRGAVRPQITKVSTETIKIREKLTITTNAAVTAASLIRLGSCTHSINTDQRRVVLKLTPAGNNMYSVDMPADYGILLPGYWWLFVMNADGTPSVGKTIKVAL